MTQSSGCPLAVTLHHFDPATASPAQWQRLHAFRRLRGEEDFPGEPLLSDEEFEADLRTHRPLHQNHRILALCDEVPVGNLILSQRRPGTSGSEDFARHLDLVGGGVAIAYRRRGVGTALLAALAEFMDRHAKTLATATVRRIEGQHFMDAVGARLKHRMVENRLRLSRVDWNELARWSADFPADAHGLRWEIHAGRVPLETLATLIEPFTQLINQVPLGTLEVPRLRYELDAYRSWYADMDRRGGEHFLVLLRDRDDNVAAMCDASWDQRYPDRMYQQLTAVAAPWRGHGLAKAAKARMLQLVRERHPQVQMAVTFNAAVNEAILSINRRLGYAVHREDATYQLDREALRHYLQRRGR